jgi:bacteriocin-like protein
MKSNSQLKLSGAVSANNEGELTDQELQTVTGGAGSLYQNCCTGKHFPAVVVSTN